MERLVAKGIELQNFTTEEHLQYCIFLKDLLTSIPDYRSYIRDQLIPMMDEHRGRTVPLTYPQILQKVFSVDDSKYGEMAELMFEIIKSKGKITAARALEVADIIYYGEQPEGYPLFYIDGSDEIDADVLPYIEGTLGVTIQEARSFCIIKYLTRIRYTGLSKSDLDRIEQSVIQQFII